MGGGDRFQKSDCQPMARQPLAKLLETLMERERESTIKSGYKSFNMFERSSFHLCSIIGGSEVTGGPKSSWISHYETEKRGSFGGTPHDLGNYF